MTRRPDSGWRPLAADDLPAVAAIAEAVHPRFHEAPEVLAERVRLYPAGAWLLEQAGAPAGYMLSHPWRPADPPPLDTRLGAIPADASSYYLHDIALVPAARGRGAAGQIVALLESHARSCGFPEIGLVAVNGSQPFWTRHGFAVRDLPALEAKLMSYEPDARYMVKPLG